MIDFSTYVSPFTWRYGSTKMRRLWSEEYKRLLFRRVWIALAQAEAEYGLVSKEELLDIKKHKDDIDIEKSLEEEKRIHHDLMAEVKVFSSQCRVGGGKIHLGATSADIIDNADAIRIKESLSLTAEKLKKVLLSLCEKIDKYSELPQMAWTHIQSAEVTTFGYRFSFYADDFFRAYKDLTSFEFLAKGFKGAVGNASSFETLITDKAESIEDKAMSLLELKAFDVTTQVYPRSQDYQLMTILSRIALSCAKVAMDFRILQSSPFSEISESFSKNQVGSSAMPFKRNPINLEKINSLSRFISSLVSVAWENAANSILERTLDDSANRRLIIPEAFLSLDEILECLSKIIDNLNINFECIEKNLKKFGVFSATEVLLMRLVKKGADRQEMHEVIRDNSLKAYDNLKKCDENNLVELLSSDSRILSYLKKDEILESMKNYSSLGFAIRRSQKVSDKIKSYLSSS